MISGDGSFGQAFASNRFWPIRGSFIYGIRAIPRRPRWRNGANVGYFLRPALADSLPQRVDSPIVDRFENSHRRPARDVG